eukprot:GHVO01004344.1.p1 GENE.GHVO01004344.1~~GHVO01004344.1.p1  ORF type:complete len:305 (+),score=41.94 GHVO01004344.1:30-917(+)
MGNEEAETLSRYLDMVAHTFSRTDKYYIARLVYENSTDELAAGIKMYREMWTKAPPGTDQSTEARKEFRFWHEAYGIKSEVDEMGPYNSEFPFAPSKAPKNSSFVKDKLKARCVGGSYVSPLPARCGNIGDSLIKFEAMLGLRILQVENTDGEMTERALQTDFCTFMNAMLPKGTMLQKFVSAGNVEADLRLVMSEGDERCLVNIKKDGDDLEGAILQAALYAIQNAMTKRKRVCWIAIAAVGLPSMTARVGTIYTIFDERFRIKSSELKIGPLFRWNTKEQCEALVGHLVVGLL